MESSETTTVSVRNTPSVIAADLQRTKAATRPGRGGTELRRIQVFVRQPFTESGNIEKEIIQGVLDLLDSLDVDVTTGLEAQSQDTFRTSFENTTGMAFTPGNFRAVRLGLLRAAEAMVFIRTSLSESGAFEAAYNVYAGPRVPMFFAVWKHAPIKTTLLRDLDEFCIAEYVTFEEPEDLRLSLIRFLIRAAEQSRGQIAGTMALAKDTVPPSACRRCARCSLESTTAVLTNWVGGLPDTGAASVPPY